MIPRSTAVDGNAGSEQIVGIEAAKGLKFFSAATRPRAALTESAPAPSWAMILSAKESLSQALAAARMVEMLPPARVAATPGPPPLVTAWMAATGSCSWPKLGEERVGRLGEEG